ncbi:MAG: DUF507 family protein [Myxococcales bacterium]|jgi:hypothetical protein|nr:DUF507 family protein [Myxococcales bacterium]
MRLHSAKVPQMAAEMVRSLMEAGDIEAEAPAEVQADLEAVLSQYIRDEQEVSEKARDMIAARGLPQSEYRRTRELFAEQRHIKLGEGAIDYLLDQMLEMLMQSSHVDEIYAPDHELRRKLRGPLRKQVELGDDLDQAVRAQLKHVQEGTSLWEVEYRRVKEDIKRRKGL